MASFGFSFGYKNLQNDSDKTPGPGAYEIKNSFIKLKQERKQSSILRPNRFHRQPEVKDSIFNEVDLKEESPTITQFSSNKKVGITFPRSQRSKLSIMLPAISQGPQKYYLPLNMGTNRKSIKFDQYSERVFDYQSYVPGVGSYFKDSLGDQSWKHIPLKHINQVIKPEPFRTLSYINKSKNSQLGPGTYDIKEGKNEGFTFMKSTRQKIEEQETPGVGDYFFDTKKETGPKFSIPKEDAKHQKIQINQQKKRKINQFSSVTPSPQHYDKSLKSFKASVDTLNSKSITFTKDRRTHDQTEQLPGPGDYELSLEFCKKSYSKRQDKPILRQINDVSSNQNSAYFQDKSLTKQKEQIQANKIRTNQQSSNKLLERQSIQQFSVMGVDGSSQKSSSYTNLKLKVPNIRRSQFSDIYKMNVEQQSKTDRNSNVESEIDQINSNSNDSDHYCDTRRNKNLSVFQKAQLLLWQFKKRQTQQNETKGTFQKSPRKLEFLDTFGISCKQERAPGPGFYEDVILEKKLTAIFPQSQKPPLFKINLTPDPGQYMIKSSFDQQIKIPLPKKQSNVVIQQLNLQKFQQIAEQFMEMTEQ